MAKKMTYAQDRAADKKAGIKEGSKRDNALDRKRGLKPRPAPKKGTAPMPMKDKMPMKGMH